MHERGVKYRHCGKDFQAIKAYAQKPCLPFLIGRASPNFFKRLHESHVFIKVIRLWKSIAGSEGNRGVSFLGEVGARITCGVMGDFPEKPMP
jgi:hypothetical protein